MNDFLTRLQIPPAEYTIMPFWFLNGDLDHAEIRRQILDFKAHGVLGFVLHPRIGLPDRIGYLSDTFFDYLRTAVETARENDMHIILYDEGMYPSGSACGQVVAGHPELASRGIALTQQPLDGDIILAETDAGCLVERFSGGTIRGIHFGEDDGEPAAPKSADILNPAAVSRFLSLTHDAYYRAFAGDFGKTIIGFFTDEPSVLGRNTRDLFPWTRGFEDIFTSAGGSLAGLTGLFTGKENADTALYHELILKRECEVYYAALSGWCISHGIALMGHPHQSDDIEFERYFHVPGQDLVLRWIAPETGDLKGMDTVMAKCSADIARLMGRTRNSNECFGACCRDGNPWYFTGADMKWYIDYLAVRGVNLFIPHAFYYSLEGPRSQERPPDVGPGSIWWPHYMHWSRYMARLSCLMSETKYLADIAVLCRNRDMHADLVAPLFATQRAFQYIPESFKDECLVKEGRLHLRGRSYSAVVSAAGQYPSVSHDAASVPPDVLCIPPEPSLRCAPLCRDGIPFWFLVNAGNEPIDTLLQLPTDRYIGCMNLWDAKICAVPCESVTDGMQMTLHLDPRESRLLFLFDSREEWERHLPDKHICRTLGADIFTCISRNPDKQEIVYEALLPACDTDIELCLKAEEMCQLTVIAGQETYDAGTTCWTPHRFHLRAAWLCGHGARLVLTVTGSRANRYGQPVFYGLLPSEKAGT
ncbi:MAG: hypothetical protein IJ242_17495 [Clostridia bacterium]|nr:hypothetical protein [Clostridia bacterium]